AATPHLAAADALAALCATLDWTLAVIWRRSASETLEVVATAGDAPTDRAAHIRAASLALAAGKSQWSDHDAILAVPMASDTALVLTRREPGSLCPFVVETTLAIATRVQNFLQKNRA